MNSKDKTEMIKESVSEILGALPEGVILVAAAKTRTLEEVLAAVEAGITHIGHNYVQEAGDMIARIGDKVSWHFIGHLQKNKANKAATMFDMIETVDSLELAVKLDKKCASLEKTLPILVEVNSGREENKNGVLPEDVDDLVIQLSSLEHMRVQGLMTMGPFTGDPEDARPFFVETRKAFQRIAEKKFPNVEMRYLSMGMSNSYKVAIDEGANIIRIGTKLFGPRHYD